MQRGAGVTPCMADSQGPPWVFYLCQCYTHSRKVFFRQNICFIGSLSFLVREELGHIKGKFLDQK